jgi:hypothetical protein
MWWHDKFFLWWTELDDPPTSRQLQFWMRVRDRGRLGYMVAGLSQIVLQVVFLLIIWSFLFALGKAFSALEYTIVILVVLLRFLPELYLRWNKNEKVFHSEPADWENAH